MNLFEQYLVNLLKDNVLYNDVPIQVVKSFSNAPILPVITLDLSGGISTEYIFHDVSEDKEITYFKRVSNININTWSNTEEERETINNAILDCFYKEKTNHYTYCSNYNQGTCKTGGNCKVNSITNRRSIKNKCPDPDKYNYQSLSDKFHITHGQIVIEPPFDMDEIDRNPPLLRSVLRARAEYEEPITSGGAKLETLNINEIDITK